MVFLGGAVLANIMADNEEHVDFKAGMGGTGPQSPGEAGAPDRLRYSKRCT